MLKQSMHAEAMHVYKPASLCDYAVEEAIIALVRLYQSYTFRLPNKLLTEPLEVTQVRTITPKDGLPVTVIKRKH